MVDVHCFFFLIPNLSAFLKKIYFSIAGKLLYYVLLVSTLQQCKSVIIMYISPPSWASLPSPHPTPLGHLREPEEKKVSSNKYEVDSLIQKSYSQCRAWIRTQPPYDSQPTRHFFEPTKHPIGEKANLKRQKANPDPWVCFWPAPE